MICNQCSKPSLFLTKSGGDSMQCKRCFYNAPFKAPSYTKYHEINYDYKFIRSLDNDPLLKRIIKIMNFKKTDNVLDFGCGAGDYTFEISKYVNSVIGVDIETDIAGKKFKTDNLTFLKQKTTTLQFSDNSFDMIVSVNVIEHVHDFEKLLLEFKRVLKPNGVLFITTYDYKFILHNTHFDPTHVIEWTKPEFEELISKHFTIKKSFKYGSFFNYYPFNKLIINFLKPELCILAKK